MKITQVVKECREQGLDFEFYPTTDLIINAVKDNMKFKNINSILDIGAGNGQTLNKLAEYMNTRGEVAHRSKYAFEINPMLKALLSKDIAILGDDFLENSLQDKKVDAIFCNPPFSNYAVWLEKIIMEAGIGVVYLVLPRRWRTDKDEHFVNQIKSRKIELNSLGFFDFSADSKAERVARAEVEVIYLSIKHNSLDWFEVEFNNRFIDIGKTNNKWETHKKEQEILKETLTDELTTGNYLECLISLFEVERSKFNDMLTSLLNMDTKLVGFLEIDSKKTYTLIKENLNYLEMKYWDEILNRFKPITSRLIEERKKSLLSKINERSLNFNLANIYNVTEMIITEAGKNIEEQAVDFWSGFLSDINCKKYKSNEFVVEQNNWQSVKSGKARTQSHYNEITEPIKLNYRLIGYFYQFVEKEDYHWNTGLTYNGRAYLQDIMVIAQTLGFDCSNNDGLLEKDNWRSGIANEIKCRYKGIDTILASIKGFKNNNLHIKFNTNFTDKLNVIVGKSKGWLHSVNDVVEEFGIKQDEAIEYFNTNVSSIEYRPSFLLT